MQEAPIGNGTLLSNTFTDGQATMWVYTPLAYGKQMLRPYTYNISQNALDILTDKRAREDGTMSALLGNREIVQRPEIAGSIVPQGNGIELDMTTTNHLWTFVLQIDIVSPWLGGSSMNNVTARRRVLYTGVFLDEPILPHTLFSASPVPNPDCSMRVTHATESVISPGANALGDSTRVTVRSDIDIVDSALDSQANDRDLYLSTPDKLLSEHHDNGITTEGLAALANVNKGVGVVSDLKSPMAHLRALLMGLDQQVSIYESSAGNTVGSHMAGAEDIYDVDSFKRGVAGEWSQMSTALNEASGAIDPGVVMKLGFVISKFPNIVIIPQRVGTDSGYTPLMSEGHVCDPTRVNPKTIYSSMIASAVSTLANNFGLSSINFSYDSYQGQYGSNRGGTFEVHDAYLAMPPSNPDSGKQLLAHALELFKRQFLLDLVPSIKASNNGDFQMHVSYMCNAETYVDFNFYDWASLQTEGIYETTNRIANITSTSVMDSAGFINNGESLDVLVHNVYGKHIPNGFGTVAFGNDPGDVLVAPAGEQGNFDY